MATNTRRRNAPGGLVLLAVCACALASARADDADPSARVARVSDVEGAISLEPAGMQEWTAATVNRPLTTGDRLWADQASRAELDLGAAAVRLGARTAFAFLNLDDNTAQMQLTAGTLIVRVRDMWANQIYEIDTPNVAVTLQQPGDYRVDVSDAGDTTLVRVSDGAASVAGGGQTVAIGMQQQATFIGNSALSYASATLGPPDELDNWSAARERAIEDSSSAEYVADDVPGTQDLDDNGTWQDTPDYGYVWMPTTVAVGWVPYRYGHWLWITPWGWTWVDDARWGYAPYHYGRWVPWRNTWCWVPGPRQLRPVYAPAQVAWVGGAALGAGNIGWFPLGPHEVYLPAYQVSAAYARSINITNTTIINNATITNIYQGGAPPTRYLNNVPAAVTTAPQSVLISAQRVSGHAPQLPPAALAAATVMASAPAIAPIPQSALGTSSNVAHPPPELARRTVVARTAPPPAPVPFDKQLAAIRANGGRPLARSELAHLQPASPAVPVKVIALAGPVISASALVRAGSQAHPHGAPPTESQAADTTSLTERERLLESSRLPSSPHPAPPVARLNPSTLPTYPPPSPRTDRPPSAQTYVPAVQQRPFESDDPTHSYGRPPSLPVYHPPVSPDPGVAGESSRSDGGYHATPATPPATSQAQHPVHVPPPPPAPKKSASEPRDAAPHGDRDSRERVVR